MMVFFIDGLPRYFPDDLPDEYFKFSQSHPDRNYCKWMIIGFCGTYHVAVFNMLADGDNKHTMAYYGEEILSLDWKKEKGY